MLRRLSISGLATIHSLSLEFGRSFSVLSGETGAGKSILVEALRFVLGEGRAKGMLRTGAQYAVVEAEFELGPSAEAREHLETLNIPLETTLCLRRTLLENGRSRAVANECSISQGALETLGALLVNIHGQHGNQALLNPARHVDFLDAYGNASELRRAVARAYRALGAAQRRTIYLEEQAHKISSQRTELEHTVQTLEEAHIDENEETQLREELHRAEHVEQIYTALSTAADLLHENEDSALQLLRQTTASLEDAAKLDPRWNACVEQLHPLIYALEEVHRTVLAGRDVPEANPERVEQINERLEVLERISRVYGGDLAAARSTLEAAQEELEQLQMHAEDLERAQTEQLQAAEQLHTLYAQLSAHRAEAALRLDKALRTELHALGWEQVHFSTRITSLEEKAPRAEEPPQALDTEEAPLAVRSQKPSKRKRGGERGQESVEFMLSANPGQPEQPLARIASGGELSRVMLALISVLVSVESTPTLIFDEVDAGISGGVAEIVGRKLRALGESKQVLCVTHLPQIAALAKNHHCVRKQLHQGHTHTEVERISGEARVQEIARLLSGLEITEAARQSALALLSADAGISNTGISNTENSGTGIPETGASGAGGKASSTAQKSIAQDLKEGSQTQLL